MLTGLHQGQKGKKAKRSRSGLKIGSREFRAAGKFLQCAKFRACAKIPTVREILHSARNFPTFCTSGLFALQTFCTSSFSALDSFGFEGD